MSPVPKPANPIRMVVCAANRHRGFDTLVLGARHFDPLMHQQINALVDAGNSRADWRASEQGFIDQRGVFMTRKEAWEVAVAAGQVKYGPHLRGGQLDSSDLY